jgi:hypothetical protein
MKKHDDVHAKSRDKFEDTNGVIRNRKSKLVLKIIEVKKIFHVLLM